MSKYSKHDVVDAYTRKISVGSSKTKTQLEIHESFQVDIPFYSPILHIATLKVVSRVKNAKNRFRALSKGAGAGQQLGSILSKLKAGADNEAKEDKKKVVINIFQSKNN